MRRWRDPVREGLVDAVDKPKSRLRGCHARALARPKGEALIDPWLEEALAESA